MAEVRNGIPMPGVTETDPVGEGNLLYSTANLVKVGFTFAQDADAGPESDGIVPAGTVVGVITASNKFAEYDDNLATGVEVAVGILLDEIDISEGDALANVALGGEFIESELTGLDANAKTDLGGVSVDVGKTTVFRF